MVLFVRNCTPHRGAGGKPEDYRDLILAWQGAGLGQVWHIEREKTWRSFLKGAVAAGVQWAASPEPGVNVSVDRLVRVQGWAPGRVLDGPATWAYERAFPQTPPAGFPAPVVAPALDSWRSGSLVDRDAEVWEPEHELRAA